MLIQRRGDASLFLLASAIAVLGLTSFSTQAIPQVWTERALGTVAKPSGRYQAGLAFDSKRNVSVLFGGMTENGCSGETWEWDGSTWTPRATGDSTRPSARYNHDMAFDTARNVVVLFGGHDETGYLHDTWEWDGAAWSQRALGEAPKPSPRQNHAMAHDRSRNHIVLFGGYDSISDDYSNETWEWDGNTWTPCEPLSPPSARMFHEMAFDCNRNRVVMFGGWGGTCFDETWEWDGSTWIGVGKEEAPRPAPRVKHAITFDGRRNTVLLFGGMNYLDGNVFGDTWQWDGIAWTQVALDFAPSPRIWHGMTFDSDRNVTVLFGGISGEDFLDETWEFTSSQE